MPGDEIFSCLWSLLVCWDVFWNWSFQVHFLRYLMWTFIGGFRVFYFFLKVILDYNFKYYLYYLVFAFAFSDPTCIYSVPSFSSFHFYHLPLLFYFVSYIIFVFLVGFWIFPVFLINFHLLPFLWTSCDLVFISKMIFFFHFFSEFNQPFYFFLFLFILYLVIEFLISALFCIPKCLHKAI